MTVSRRLPGIFRNQRRRFARLRSIPTGIRFPNALGLSLADGVGSIQERPATCQKLGPFRCSRSRLSRWCLFWRAADQAAARIVNQVRSTAPNAIPAQMFAAHQVARVHPMSKTHPSGTGPSLHIGRCPLPRNNCRLRWSSVPRAVRPLLVLPLSIFSLACLRSPPKAQPPAALRGLSRRRQLSNLRKHGLRRLCGGSAEDAS